MMYYFAPGMEQRGPYALGQLAQLGLRPDTLVWHEGMADWQRLDSLPELSRLILPPREVEHAPQSATPMAEMAERASPQALVVAPGASNPPGGQQLQYHAPVLPGQPTNNGMAVAAMVLGILSLVMYCISAFFSPFLAIAALVVGYIARGQIRRGEASGESMARTGIICGWISLALLVVGILVIAGIFLFIAISS
jgi:hypothetical protein